VRHTYTSAGTFEVAVTVTDARGKSSVGTMTIEVHANRPPVVEVAQVPAAVTGDTVYFSANVSDEDGDTYTYWWDMGDGDTSSLVAPRHIYEEPGTYTVTLTVEDSEGGVTTRTFEVVIDKAKKDDDDDGTPGFGAMLAAAALLAVVIHAAWFRRD
jgi:PKD repeat protein